MTGRTLVRILAASIALVAGLALRAPSAAADEPGLVHVGTTHVDPRLDELTFTTPALVGETKVRILLPQGYDPESDVRYPVLYLLHGGTGSFVDWTTQGDAEAISAGYPLIIVMPDGSGFGNYVDWWNFGDGGPPMWETYHIDQLLPWVDAHYNTIPSRDARAIAGLSMGGGGAGHYASRHPDLFTAAGMFSGAVDTNTVPVQLLVETSGMPEGHQAGAIFGHRPTDEVRWRGHNTWDLAENLEGLFLQLDTGNGSPGGPAGDTGDPIETGCWQMMTNLHDRLVELGLRPHLELLRRGGPQLVVLAARPEGAAAPPDGPLRRSGAGTEPVHLHLDRPHLRCVGLERRDRPSGPRVQPPARRERGGVQAHGQRQRDRDDRAAVRTRASRWRRPSPTRRANTIRCFVADDGGRLTIPLSLGEGNPFQERTTEGRRLGPDARAPRPATWPAVTATVDARARRGGPRRRSSPA